MLDPGSPSILIHMAIEETIEIRLRNGEFEKQRECPPQGSLVEVSCF
jgi:hypothetical protein